MRVPIRGWIMWNRFCEKIFRFFFVELLGLATAWDPCLHFVIRCLAILHWDQKQSWKRVAIPIDHVRAQIRNIPSWITQTRVETRSHSVQTSEESVRSLSEKTLCSQRILSWLLWPDNKTNCVSRKQLCGSLCQTTSGQIVFVKKSFFVFFCRVIGIGCRPKYIRTSCCSSQPRVSLTWKKQLKANVETDPSGSSYERK